MQGMTTRYRRWRPVTLGLALAAIALASLLPLGTTAVQAAETIKVGVLHSLSGTMAISETTLKDTVLMMIDEQNKKGGLLGKQLEAVVVDPASNWPLFAEKTREQYCGQNLGRLFGNNTIVAKGFVLRAGFFQTQPVS